MTNRGITETAADAPLVRAQGLTKRRRDRTLWSDLTFEVHAASSLALTGPSGSGKTTLLNCIGLLERWSSGTLEVEGLDAASLSAVKRRQLLRTAVGHVYQNYGLVESWTVNRNLNLAFVGQGLGREARAQTRTFALQRVGLEGYGSLPTYSLSGGEQQRVALARLLMKRPRIAVVDEPSAALDRGNVDIALSVLDELRDGETALIIATHDSSVVSWCDEQLTFPTAVAVQ
ncbi:MAG: lipoprotein transporter ATP-binding protein [Frondihabitans sp.]|nr:lipoprotein transporter ATP-binding protein [Frondihabitans sp.]